VRRAAGFTLISAIFLMVVLAILGTSLVTLSSVQHATSAQQLQTVRASYAARAGVEWAAKQAEAGSCIGGTVTPGGALAGFTVTVACSVTNHDLGAPLPQQYGLVTVTAQAGVYGSADYVTRRVQAKVLGTGP
jgi:MSHA biogenesis protein MshP